MTISTISAPQLAELCQQGDQVDLIDVRTPVEFREVHVDIARNVPLDQLDPAALMQARNGSANEPLYVICRSGSRGQQACEKFLKAGFSNVVNVEGGTMACVKLVCRSSVARRRSRWSGRCASQPGRSCCWGRARLVRPSGIHRAVGLRRAGLVFAGITDTCGMGMMLARMPWNQCSQERFIVQQR